MRQMWCECLRENPDLQTTSLKGKNKGHVISFSAFRHLLNKELKDLLSFRKARQDTCQVCVKLNSSLDKLRAAKKSSENNTLDVKICELQAERASHQREREVRFASEIRHNHSCFKSM